MNKLQIILNELPSREHKNCISSCYTKVHGWHGAPRIVIDKKDEITDCLIDNYLSKTIQHFESIDRKYHKIIDKQDAEAIINDNEFRVIVDKARISFFEDDDLYEEMPLFIKSNYHFSIRKKEKDCLTSINKKHLENRGCLVSECILAKYNQLWTQKWNNESIYKNYNDTIEISNLISGNK